ncbi:MAG: tetratricopeptide repeat protein [Zymomonas mobilis]|uniref:tetratricopeptide repeat protein n=1 Tax=Zymomonas mobilis TaxID=542 RepID=UPI0039EC158B
MMKLSMVLSVRLVITPLWAEANPPAVMTAPQAFTQAIHNLKSQNKDDQARGFIKMQQAASGGNPKAEYNLGALYHEGLGTTQDFVQARYWIEKSAEQGYPAAEALLGNIYHFGRKGIPEDLEKAFYWTEKAANRGVTSAQRDLALIYHQ